MFKELNISICLVIFMVISTDAQILRHFEVAEGNDIDLVSLNFSSYKGYLISTGPIMAYLCMWMQN